MFEAATAINTRVVCGHVLLQPPGMEGKWVSRAPLERGMADALVKRMRLNGARYGILDEREIGGRNIGILTVHASLDSLREQMGAKKIGTDFGGTDLAMNDARTVMAFEFPVEQGIGVDSLRFPRVDVNYAQARGLAKAMGLDLPTDQEFLWVLQGATEGTFFTSPEDPNFRNTVHCSIGTQETGTIDVEDKRYGDQPHGTRHWLGNDWKWMLRNFAERHQFAYRGGGYHSGSPGVFAPSYRDSRDGVGVPDFYFVDLGLVCVGGAQDSMLFYPWLF